MKKFLNSFYIYIRRRYILGLVLLFPLAVTYFIAAFAFNSIDGILQPIIKQIFGRSITGLSFITIFITTSIYFGRKNIYLAIIFAIINIILLWILISKTDKLSIIAVGGYGRRQLSPGSDIDLLILTPYKLIPRTEQIVETLLYILWDMKIKVGYSIRHINETIMKAKNDNTICTSLLDARFIAGDYELWDVFSKEFKSKILNVEDKKYFFEKIAEQKLRHNKMGDSQYLLEPNIKEGKGGLRDIHTMKWIIYFLYGVREFNIDISI